ncbi:hypothetical protein O181_015202 [Austropuccinia psidii MF-1]|uniref:Uncharacterized protein n=1 Tax=Austropuccinia psidii MF-1 TaxID=1389203 RepID=A0A9Q3C371_9BASI|nr:hypothetical protein [Austropuccinia psidii MF-1]
MALLHNHFVRLSLLITKEENYIPLDTQSDSKTPVTPSEPEGSKAKGKRHSEGLIKAKRWTTIATQRNRKPQNSASIQGKPTLTTCTGKIKVINPVVTSKGKLPKAVDNKFVQGTVKETLVSKGTSQRTEKACPEPADLEEDTLDTVVDGKTFREIIPTLPFKFQFNRNLKPEDWKDMDQVLQLHQLLKDLFQWSMDNKRFNLASHRAELGESYQKICLKEIDFIDLMVITKGWNPTRQFRLLEVRENMIKENQATIQAIQEQLTQTGHTQIPSGSQVLDQTSFPEKTRIQGQKQDHLQTKEDRVRPNDPEAVGFGERSTQQPELGVHSSRISSPINRYITSTQIKQNVVTPESNMNSDSLWFQMSQYAEQTEKQFLDPEASHERMKKLTASMDKIVKTLQEGHSKLRKASEETRKRLNLVFEEQNHSKRDRDFLDQDINKLFNVYHNMKPQPQGHVMDNPYHQEEIKPDSMLVNKTRSPSKYQEGENMSYSEKEALKQLPEASSWPKFSGTGEYDHMELTDYDDGL